MMKIFRFKQTLAVCILTLVAFTSCEDDNNDPGTINPPVVNDFHIALANGSGSNSATVIQGIADLSKGAINSQVGHQMESSRTARIFSSVDGTTIYSLNYTEGTVEKLTYQGGDKYTRVKRIDTSVPLGVKTVRFTKLSETEASLHYIKATAQYDGEGENAKYLKHVMTASIGILDLEFLTMKDGYKKDITIELPTEYAAQGYYISRIDSPVLSEGKLYYGAAVSIFNPSTGKGTDTDRTFTLVLDYPTLGNPTTISTTKVKGSTNGYRTPTQYKNEAGEILQLVDGGKETHIIKIKNGQYDSSFDFNLTQLLGKPTSSNGWFYAGNGIGYVPYQDKNRGEITIGVDPNGNPTTSSMWKLARIDLNKGRVVDLNVPDDLWLQQYQTSVVRDGIFYIALAPVGKNGNIYMFDVDSESKDATLGATIAGTGADQYYIGIY